jgi:hypothetical protein
MPGSFSYNKTVVILATVFIVIVGTFLAFTYETTFSIVGTTASDFLPNSIISHNATKLKNPPHPIKGIYISAWSNTDSSKIDNLIKLINETELNGVVLDVKDYSGKFTYAVNVPLAKEVGALGEIKIKDIDAYIEKFHKNNIYVIGRVQVFQDPMLAKARPDIAIKELKTGKTWKDNKGLEWLDPSSRIVWDYAVDIAKDMSSHGFDEVNFDYVRFPADGDIEKMDFPFWDAVRPKYELISSFFYYISDQLKNTDIATSVDLFGLASWRALDFSFDLNIGQRLVDALPYFDYVSPMVYPSHYPKDFNGIKNPSLNPYEIIYGSLITWKELKATTTYKAVLRPWLQDFDLGGVRYDKTKVRAQIQAAEDLGIDSWLLWNSSSKYTRDALLVE